MSSPSRNYPIVDAAAGQRRPGILGFFLDFHNRTVLFRVGNWIVTTYAFLAGLAFFMGFSVAVWYVAMAGLDPISTAQFYIFFLVPAILIGLRSFSILLEWRELLKHPLATMVKPGYMLHGGIFGAVMATWAYASITGTSLPLLLDASAMAVTIGEAFARMGCYVYGCCWGRPTESRFGVRYTSPDAKVVRCAPHLHGVKIHPAQLYGLVAHLALFTALYAFLPYKPFDGAIGGIYFISHSLIRFCLERFRQDDRGRLWGPLTHTNLYSMVMIIGGAAMLLYGSRYGVNTPIDMGVRWIHMVTDWTVVRWIVMIGTVFGLAYGVHYKKVGSWIAHASGGVKPNVDELSMGAAQRLDRIMHGDEERCEHCDCD